VCSVVRVKSILGKRNPSKTPLGGRSGWEAFMLGDECQKVYIWTP
jgi:hypothetical protein